MRIFLLVGSGSFIGGVLRYSLSQFIQAKFISVFPFGTFAVNIIGCFVIGILFGLSMRTNINDEWLLFFATGICGGFTTFSAFSNDTFGLLQNGQYWYALFYVVSSLFFGILATFSGYAILKLF